MAHGLETFGDGHTAFVTARQPAWHRLGTVTPDAMTAEEALSAARLSGWNVVKRPVLTTTPAGIPVPVKGKYATVRKSPDPLSPAGYDALGVVGEDYEIIQNEQAFDFLTDLAQSGEAVFETAGSLRGGSRVFVTMRMPEPLKIVQDDHINLYVAVTTGHDGLSGFNAMPTPVRIVCQNTLSLALRGNKRVQRVRHDSRAEARMVEARQILKLTLEAGKDLQTAAKEMIRTPVSSADFDSAVAKHFVSIDHAAKDHVKRSRMLQRETLRALFRDSPTQEVGRGTAWAAFNAVVEWAEWARQPRMDGAASAQSALDGRVAEIRQQAFEIFNPSPSRVA